LPSDSAGGAPTNGPVGRRPQGAVFDCDGLLVDTRHCWEAAYRVALAEAGADVSPARFATLCRWLSGASVDLAAEGLSTVLGRDISADLLRDALAKAVARQSLMPMPGAEQLLAVLRGTLPLAVASNAPRPVLDQVLSRAGLRDPFSDLVSADEVAAPKPDPAVYLEACRRLSIDPRRAVALEDSPLGAAAARAAGLFLIAVPSERDAEFDADIVATTLGDPKILAALGPAG
jgi:HAD superfamily hydrolase (TIGR01509 family)